MKRLREEDNLIDERVYESEWKTLRRAKATTVNADFSTSSQNRSKNRYSDILALNCSRVKLSCDDYIHANYVDGARDKAYIATQAPLPRTFGDFWGMVHDEKVAAIVMLTKLFERKPGKSGKMRAKADRYWPARPGLTCQYGAIEVEFLSENCGPDDEKERSEKEVALDEIGMEEESESASIEHHWCVRRFMIKRIAEKDGSTNNKNNLRSDSANSSPAKSKQSSPPRIAQHLKEKPQKNTDGAFHERLSSIRTEKDGELEGREVVQFHFQSWPDQSVPSDTDALLRFMRLVNETVNRNVPKRTRNNTDSNGALDSNATGTSKGREDEIAADELPSHSPLLVHCSAGVGRTGVYCLVDAWINKFQSIQLESATNSNSCGNSGGGLTRSNSNLCYLNTCSNAVGPVSAELTNLFQAILGAQVCSNSKFNSNAVSTPTLLLPLASLPPSHSIKSLLLAMRRQRSEFVQSLEQYKFCYEVLNYYLASNALAT